MIVALLDVNVLIALLDDRHVHHGAAHRWFQSDQARRWATCPLTENGFVRIVGQAAYKTPFATDVAMDALQSLCDQDGHFFWPDSVSLLTVCGSGTMPAPPSRHVTDTYLLALALANQGTLATFDRRIAIRHADRAAAILTIEA